MNRPRSLRNLLIPACILIAALTLLLLTRTGLIGPKPASPGTGTRILVYVNGELTLDQPLEPGGRIEILQADGQENVVRMTENGFYMEDANCDNQDCMWMGEVTEDNYRTRVLTNRVICLPNRVEIQLIPDGGLSIDIPDA